MIDIDSRIRCCGMRELDGLTEWGVKPAHVIYGIARERFYEDERFAFVVLSEEARYRRLEALHKYLFKYGLGTLTITPIKRNPNSSNNIRSAIFAIDSVALRAWWKRNKNRAGLKGQYGINRHTEEEDYDNEDDNY